MPTLRRAENCKDRVLRNVNMVDRPNEWAALLHSRPMDSSNPPDADVTLVVVYRTQNVALWGMTKSILDAAPVEYWVRGERLLTTMFGGWSEWGHRPDLDVEFLVREADGDWVRELLADLTPASGTVEDSE
jgi:hypothetical protein